MLNHMPIDARLSGSAAYVEAVRGSQLSNDAVCALCSSWQFGRDMVELPGYECPANCTLRVCAVSQKAQWVPSPLMVTTQSRPRPELPRWAQVAGFSAESMLCKDLDTEASRAMSRGFGKGEGQVRLMSIWDHLSGLTSRPAHARVETPAD